MVRLLTFFSCCLLGYGAFAQGVFTGTLRPGDLLFQDLDCGELCDAIEQVTESFGGRHFSHVGLVDMEGSHVIIIEAIGEKVQRTPLASFLARSKNELMLGRLKQPYRKLIPGAMAYARKQVGTPYDEEFIYDNGRYYCSELLYDAFRVANEGRAFFMLQPMTFKEPGSDSFFQVWTAYYAKLKKPVPEGEAGINPGGISLSDKLDMYIYRK